MKRILNLSLLLSTGLILQGQVQVDVIGDIMRLTSISDSARYIQLRTDGSGVDIDTKDFLWIHSLGVRIPNMDTITTTSANVVKKVDGTLALRQYKIGDMAQGGIIFYVDESGEHGLVCDTADIVVGNIQWYNGVYKVTNATGDGVGSGEMNTMLIIAQQTIDNPDSNFAALPCANLVRGEYGDWYLPSKEELNLLYTNKAVINATALSNGGSSFGIVYWSSTEGNGENAWGQKFDSGDQFNDSKGNGDSFRVRAIRAF